MNALISVSIAMLLAQISSANLMFVNEQLN